MTIGDNRGTINNSKKTSDDFIMKPKVDYCFKELMAKKSIRNNFIAALLKKKPEDIRDSELLPTEMLGDYADVQDSLASLARRVRGAAWHLPHRTRAHPRGAFISEGD